MNTFVERYSTTSPISQLRKAQRLLVDEDGELSDAAWGSEAGFGNLAKGLPTFTVPDIPDVSSPLSLRRLIIYCCYFFQPTAFLRLHTDDHADPSCRIKIQHGTTTLAFRFQGGVIVSVDSRATAGSYIGKYIYFRNLEL